MQVFNGKMAAKFYCTNVFYVSMEFQQEFHQLDEMRRTYKADLKHAKQTVERIEIEKIIDRRTGGSTPPLYSQAYTEWL